MAAFFNCSFKNKNGTLNDIQAGSIMNLPYTHDGAGNVKTISGVSRAPLSPGVKDYTHTANKLDGSTGKVAKTYTHDDAGNIISDGGRTFVYNQNNRLIQVKNGETIIAEYAYDGFGRRVMKTVGSDIVHYHYDLAGQLICEADGSGNAVRDYVYLNGEPVAMQLYGDDAGWYYFVNDHLGTPQKVVDSAGAVVWEAGYLPFGEARLLVADIDNNLRFPGQYFDGETGLHYNWNRFYDPESGRYWTADPIGLSGGINLYAYVSGNPVNWIDFNGLYRSHWVLRALVPGQVAWDNALTALENGELGDAALYAGAMVGEQVLSAYMGKISSLYAGKCSAQSVSKSGTSLKNAIKKTNYKPTQSAKRFDMNKVDNYAKQMKSGKWDWNKMKDPIITDSKNNIMSGHHRILASEKAGVKIPESAIKRISGETVRPTYSWDDVLP